MGSPKSGKFRVAVVDRGALAGQIEAVGREHTSSIEVVSCRSALEVVGENGPGGVAGLAVTVEATGPFLTDLLRWTESQGRDRIPTLLLGSGTEQDEGPSRMIIGRDHVRWLPQEHKRADLERWLLASMEVFELRQFRAEHEAVATSVREARLQLFHGFIQAYTPPESPPCGPALPTNIDEIQPLRDARAQFERSHIQAAVRERGSLKDASAALGISYTSLWRRLR